MANVFDSQGTGSTRTFDAQVYAAPSGVSSALAWLEASDTVAITGSTAAPGVTAASIGWTEAADVVAIAGIVPLAPVVPQAYYLTTISADPIYFDTPLLENE